MRRNLSSLRAALAVLAVACALAAVLWPRAFPDGPDSAMLAIAKEDALSEVVLVSNALREAMRPHEALAARLSASPLLRETMGLAEGDPSSQAEFRSLLREEGLPPLLLLPAGSSLARVTENSASFMLTAQENYAWCQALRADTYARRAVHGPFTTMTGKRYILLSRPIVSENMTLGQLVLAVDTDGLSKDVSAGLPADSHASADVVNTRGNSVIFLDSHALNGETRLRPFLEAMHRGGKGVLEYALGDDFFAVAYAALPEYGWTVASSRFAGRALWAWAAWMPLILGVAAFLALAGLLTLSLRTSRRRAPSEQDVAEAYPAFLSLAAPETLDNTYDRIMLQAAWEAILVLDPTGAILSVNDAALRMLRYARASDMIGQNVHALIHHHHEDGSTYPEEECRLLASCRQGTPAAVPLTTLWRRDGTSFLATAKETPLLKDGAAAGAVIVFFDVTDLHAREALRQTVFAASTDAYIILGENRSLVDANPAAMRLFKTRDLDTLRQLTEQGFPLRAGHPDDDTLGRAEAAFRQALEEGQAELELTMQAQDGEELPCAVSLVRVDMGSRRAVFANLHDLRAARRTEKSLTEARDAAEAAVRAKNDFLSRMSHELRTPMNAILGMGYLCLQTKLTAKQRDFLDKIQEAAQSLLGMVNDILDFSKAGSDSMTLSKGPFRLDLLLESISGSLAQRAQQKNLEFLVRLDPHMPKQLIGDSLRLSQVLQVLMGNAIKFTESGEVIVEIFPDDETDEGLHVHFQVKDTGIGMTAEQMGKLFQPFSQGDDSPTRRFGGAGLGLAISRSLVELMGGRIWAESRPGEGSVFHFTLWLDKEGVAMPPLSRDFSDMTALVVDDNAPALDVMVEQVEALGLRATPALSGREALDILEKKTAAGKRFDILMLDWKMPDLDGVETAHLAHTSFSPEARPLILLVSAVAERPDQEILDRNGIAAFLPKPLSSHLLRATLARLREEQIRQTETPPVPQPPSPSSHTLEDIRGARVLLVEDNDINQEIARALLEDAGMIVDAAANGEEAVQRIREAGPGAYNLVFMDIQMPVMDGLTAAAAIRKLGHGPETLPIVAMTAHSQPIDREKSLQAGMNDHITKPLIPDRLFATLLVWIRPGDASAKIAPHLPKAPAAEGTARPDVTDRRRSPNLSQKAGLENVGGNSALYAKLLRKFRDSCRSSAKDIRQAMALADDELAVRLAHTVKGVSASLGLTALAQTASGLEKALKGQPTDRGLEESLLPAFEADLRHALDAVEEYLKEIGMNGYEASSGMGAAGRPSEDERDSEVSPEAAAEAIVLLKALLDSLEADWGNVLNCLDGLTSLLKTACASSLYDLSVALENFDIPRARVAAHQLEVSCLALAGSGNAETGPSQ